MTDNEGTKAILFEVRKVKIIIKNVEFEFTMEELEMLKIELNELFKGKLVEKAVEDAPFKPYNPYNPLPVYPQIPSYPQVPVYPYPYNPSNLPLITWSYTSDNTQGK